jgi:hypothetical protein
VQNEHTQDQHVTSVDACPIRLGSTDHNRNCNTAHMSTATSIVLTRAYRLVGRPRHDIQAKHVILQPTQPRR